MHKYRNLLVIILLLVLVFFGRPILAGIKLVPFFFQLVFGSNVELKKSDGSVNILLLGIGGGAHDGTNLSDTIIFASINQAKNKISLVSIPRDLWISNITDGHGGRVNEAYEDGEQIRKGGGLVLAEAVISKVVGQPIDYGVRVDFAGFVKAVDTVGGLDVAVDNTFDDYIYPIEGREASSCGRNDTDIQAFTQTASASAEQNLAMFFPCRYQHIHFDQGLNHMTGVEVLEFVRSRHAVGSEGTDFARSVRQQKVIKAFKDKILSLGILLNPGKVMDLYDVLKSSIDTDISQNEFDDFIRLANKVKGSAITNAVLDYGDTERPGLLLNPAPTAAYDYAWVLIPRIGMDDFTEIQKYVSCEIVTGNCAVSKLPGY
jgi:polyisoprenyl-teichoic acid--peptidoglycan teichoic acid transferase